MFTTDEGEGWQQLGEGLMPSSAKDAGVMLDGFKQIGEQTLHSVFTGSSLPDLKSALGAMYNPQPLELDVSMSKFPGIELYDSGAGSGVQQLGGAELGSAPSPGLESTGIQAVGPSGPGTIETLQAPALDQAGAMSAMSPSGAESSYFSPMDSAGADATASLSDATPLGDMGKAFGDVMSKMGDMLGSLAHGPMGLLGSVLNFLLTIFSEIISSIGHVMEETARAAASLAAEAWKKQLGAAT